MSKVIKFEGGNNFIVWKHPTTVLDDKVDLIVPFSHEAIFVKDGVALETFDAGKYTINEKENRSLFSKKDETASCGIYFINKTSGASLKWGTTTPLDIFDPKLNMPVSIGANGEFEIKVNNSRKLLHTVVGSKRTLTVEDIGNFFRAKIMLHIKDLIAEEMTQNKIDCLSINTRLLDMSVVIKDNLVPVFDEYGVTLVSFVISSFLLPENVKIKLKRFYDSKQQLEEAGTVLSKEDEKKLIEKEFGQNILSENDKMYCFSCGSEMPKTSKFCNHCGTKVKGDIKICPFCGDKVYANFKFCNNCGKRL